MRTFRRERRYNTSRSKSFRLGLRLRELTEEISPEQALWIAVLDMASIDAQIKLKYVVSKEIWHYKDAGLGFFEENHISHSFMMCCFNAGFNPEYIKRIVTPMITSLRKEFNAVNLCDLPNRPNM